MAQNQAMLDWPSAATIDAAPSAPSAPPVLPPTWNIDWAKPRRGPADICATREDSGWNTLDPIPTIAAASSSTG